MKITLKNPLDMHLHLREGELLKAVLPYSANVFSGAVVMPNLKEPVDSLDLANKYKKDIENLLDSTNQFKPLCAIYLSDRLNKNELKKCAESNFKILKLYPKGATTGSEKGVDSVINKHNLELFETAQELNMILSIHGESNGESLDREAEFGEVFSYLASKFPKLKIIIEHMSDRRSIPLLNEFDNIYATLSLHHISLSIDSIIGKNLNPHYFCKPILKTKIDQQELLQLALNAHKKVSFGSDSAPHLLESKLKGAAGIFSAPVLLPKLCEIFDRFGKLDNLQAFISDNAFKNYELDSMPQKEITLQKIEPKTIEEITYKDSILTPIFVGEKLTWEVI